MITIINLFKSGFYHFRNFILFFLILSAVPFFGQPKIGKEETKFIKTEIERIIPKRFFSFEEGIDKTVIWYLKNEWWWKRILSGQYKLERFGKDAS